MLQHLQPTSYLALSLVVLLGAYGAPLPLGVALAAAGALARQGHLNIVMLAMCCLVAAVTGDILGYLTGRLLLRRLPAQLFGGVLRRPAYRRLHGWIERHADLGLAVFLSRWALTALGTGVNLLAGYRGYDWRRFVGLDLLGEALWVAMSLAPGLLFGDSDGYGLEISIGAGVGLAVLVPLLSRSIAAAHAVARPERRPLPAPLLHEPAA